MYLLLLLLSFSALVVVLNTESAGFVESDNDCKGDMRGYHIEVRQIVQHSPMCEQHQPPL